MKERILLAIAGAILITIAFISFIVKWEFTDDIQIALFSFFVSVTTIAGSILIGLSLRSDVQNEPTDPYSEHQMD